MARKIPIFPKIDNERSMLHIDNLCEFIRLMIENNERGLFFPQNNEYVNTSKMVDSIAKAHCKKVILTKAFNPFIKIFSIFSGVINKMFGNLVYEKSMSEYRENYRVRNLEESIKLTESEV